MKFVVDRKIIKVDIGGQIIHVKKIGVLDYQKILKAPINIKDIEKMDPIKGIENGINLMKRVVVDWEGFKNEGGKEIPFSEEIFGDFLDSLSSSEIEIFMEAVMGILEPTVKDKKKVEELNTDIKNLKTTSRK